MKIEARGNDIVLKEIHSGVILETREGKKLHICTRDYGFDINFEDGKVFHMDEDTEIIINKKIIHLTENQFFG